MLPPWFFHYLPHPFPIAMAKRIAAAAQDEQPATEAPTNDAVPLRSEELGETRDFSPAHAKALLAYQAEKGLHLWQLAEVPAGE